ncbi:hypothetical protein PVAND_001510 [Polypedilum vanderplanki]|uniref:Lipase domain-containing protein n=1 Tax=Polypedilum vanderplanki TaxID=319348 RepID=A0A9J6BN57_POLVA|nr:hypothetical protein PVAND_001510 [Polypedilum vanderplanki]
MTSTSNFKSLSSTYYTATKTTVFYTGGWLLNYTSFDAQTILGAYLATRRSTHNLIYVDWSYYSKDIYFVPMIMKIDCVAQQISAIIQKFRFDTWISPQTFHFIGFQYGAHVLAYGARKLLPPAVKRLTALDPGAALDFTDLLFTRYGIDAANWKDADFVDVIHTSAFKFGYGYDTGHIDFYVNGGSVQNGCTILQSIKDYRAANDIKQIYLLVCSHSRAVYYYAESVKRPNTSPLPFLSARCGLVYTFNSTTCTNTLDNVSMGFYAYNPAGIGFGLSKRFYVETTNNTAKFSLT